MSSRSEAKRKDWQNPQYRARMIEARQREARKLWRNPQYRESMSRTRRKLWRTLEFRARIMAAKCESAQKPKFRARMRELTSKLWQNPEFRFLFAESLKRSRPRRMKSYRRLGRRITKGCELAKLMKILGIALKCFTASERSGRTKDQHLGSCRPDRSCAIDPEDDGGGLVYAKWQNLGAGAASTAATRSGRCKAKQTSGTTENKT